MLLLLLLLLLLLGGNAVPNRWVAHLCNYFVLRPVVFRQLIEISFAQIVIAIYLAVPGANKRLHVTLVAANVAVGDGTCC